MYAGLGVRNLKYSQSLAKEISPTGEGVNHVVNRGEFELLETRMRCAKQAKLTHAILSQKKKVPGTENTFLWNGNVYDSGT